MSELQAALLLIGAGVMVAVYLYGWWQQRRLSRKFGTVFKASHADALYRGNPAQSAPPGQHILVETSTEALPGATVAVPADDAPAAPPNALDESCALLDGRSDFMLDLHLHEPATGAVLGGFWQRKFDFGKPLQVCGLTLQDQRWERVIADSQTLYVSLRIALQMVDRGGVISAIRLADFRDLILGIARQIQAETGVADITAAHARAAELDALCAAVDQMVGINLVPPGERLLPVERIAQAATLHDMRLESDGAFHFFNAQGQSVFSLTNRDTKPFQHHTLATASSTGITLLLDVPRVAQPVLQFDLMTRVAHDLARELQLNLVDDQHVVLTAGGLQRIRAQIAGVEAQMTGNGIVPGSAQARRLFA